MTRSGPEPPDLAAAMQSAVAQHQAGHLAEAIAAYRHVLALRPGHPDALHMLGLAAYQQGRHAEAIDLIGRAIAANAGAPPYFNNRGLALAALGRFAEAVASYERALALRPGYAQALVNRGMALRGLGRPAEALASFDGAIALAPDLAAAQAQRGDLLMETGRFAEALAGFGRALTLAPGEAMLHLAHGNALARLERPGEAVASFGCALALRPDFPEAHNNHGLALRELSRPAEAVASYDRALALRPDFAEAHNNRGVALADLGRLQEAVAAYARAIALRPDLAEPHTNLGTAQTALGDPEAGLSSYRRAMALVPDAVDARVSAAYNLLLLGRLREGWDGQEWRWRKRRFAYVARRFAQPQWRGEPLAGRSVLLHAEQGFGDTIQFSRYAPLVAAQGGRVLLEVQRPLAKLFEGRFPGVRVLAQGDELPAFDLHCPLLSLPLAFGTELASIPPPSQFRADPARAAQWRARLQSYPAPRVGLAWSGNATHVRDRDRSIPLADLLPLRAGGATLFGLQPEVRPADRAAMPALVDLGPGFGDFAETAAAISVLDLVIAADTSVAHLAASLGKPTWVLLAFAPDWRWMLGRDDSPWYPSARLFRQPARGDWASVVTHVAAELSRRGTQEWQVS